MAVQCRSKQLAGIGAIVGLCLAGAGCQTTALRPDRYAVQADAPASSRATLATTQKVAADPVPSGTVVSIGRPVASDGTDKGNAAVASSWQPVQRASAEEISAAPARPETVLVQAPAPLLTPAEPPVVIDAPLAAGPVTGDKPGTGDKPNDKDTTTLLHPPTPLGSVVGPPAHCGSDGAPTEFSKQSLPPYVVEPPDILLIQSSEKVLDQPVSGQHLVRPDGFVSLGIYGEVYVAGMTLAQVRAAITEQLRKRKPTFDGRDLDVDVIAYNSKVYYIITDGGGFGEQVYRIPVTGNETILDAMAQINGLPAVASKKCIWLARATPDGQPIVLPIDWRKVTMLGSGATNYQVFPGDRIYVGADPWIRTDSWLAKRLAPVERLLGVTLLGSSTVNSIRNRSTSGNGSLP
jgi:polysaccharide biosynthesis/export protein